MRNWRRWSPAWRRRARSGRAPSSPTRRAPMASACSSPLAALGCIPLAIHPAMTFTGADEDIARLADTCFGITAADEIGYAIAQSLVLEIGGEPFGVREDARTLYHAALAHASNHVVTVSAGRGGSPAGGAAGSGAARPGDRRRGSGRDRRTSGRPAGPRVAGEHAAAGSGGADGTGRPRRRGARWPTICGRSPRWILNSCRHIGPTHCVRRSGRTLPTRYSPCWRGWSGVTVRKPPKFAAGELNVYRSPPRCPTSPVRCGRRADG